MGATRRLPEPPHRRYRRFMQRRNRNNEVPTHLRMVGYMGGVLHSCRRSRQPQQSFRIRVPVRRTASSDSSDRLRFGNGFDRRSNNAVFPEPHRSSRGDFLDERCRTAGLLRDPRECSQLEYASANLHWARMDRHLSRRTVPGVDYCRRIRQDVRDRLTLGHTAELASSSGSGIGNDPFPLTPCR